MQLPLSASITRFLHLHPFLGAAKQAKYPTLSYLEMVNTLAKEPDHGGNRREESVTRLCAGRGVHHLEPCHPLAGSQGGEVEDQRLRSGREVPRQGSRRIYGLSQSKVGGEPTLACRATLCFLRVPLVDLGGRER
jgi:hypothetical protein